MNLLTLRIGTRGSQLALWQANHVAAQLRASGHAVEIEVIRTSGDRLQNPPPPTNGLLVGGMEEPSASDGLSPNSGPPADDLGSVEMGGTGIFIKEIEDALVAGRIDIAVHSLKDLPTTSDPRLTLAAIPPRADARDAFVCEEHWGLHTLPSGARIATTSPRRKAMILALRPDLAFVEMRGNIDTRLRKWESGECDALILAAAGLDRLGCTQHVHQRFAVDELCPAPGQGALALQIRCPSGALKGTGLSPYVEAPEDKGALAHVGAVRDLTIHAIVRTLNCSTTEYAVTAERAVLAVLGGGCQLPLGAYCYQVGENWHMHAMVVSPEGDQVAHVMQRSLAITSAADFGESVAQALIARGALDLLQTHRLGQFTTWP